MKNKITKYINMRVCKFLTLCGFKKCKYSFEAGQSTINMLNNAMNIDDKDLDVYEMSVLEPLSTWLGEFDFNKCEIFSKYINSRMCTNITPEELMTCFYVDDVSKLIIKHSGVFFPKKCKKCIDIAKNV
jgi:hypothetical protein